MNSTRSAPIGFAQCVKHEDYEAHEAVWAYGAKYLFCSGFGLTKQIFTRAKAVFCLINPHLPHVFKFVRQVTAQFMRIMRIYEGGLFNGFYLPCIYMGVRQPQKHEAVMRQHEDIFILAGDLA